MSSLTYLLAPQIAIEVQEQPQQINKAIVLNLLIDFRHQLTVVLNLDELSAMVNPKWRPWLRSLDGLTQFIHLVIRWFNIQLPLAIKLRELTIKPPQSVATSMEIKLASAAVAIIYLEPAAQAVLETILTKLHHQYMLKYSRAFNSPLNFPVIIASATITPNQLAQLTPGSVILFDQIMVGQPAVKCQLGSVHVDLELN